jgi:hypothetical protein
VDLISIDVVVEDESGAWLVGLSTAVEMMLSWCTFLSCLEV